MVVYSIERRFYDTKILTTYNVKIKRYNHIFKNTVSLYRKAVAFFINVCLNEWHAIEPTLSQQNACVSVMEHLTVPTDKRPCVKYDFNSSFYKMPCYLRRAAIMDAVGRVSSYKSNLSNWEKTDVNTRGREPSMPKAGFAHPCLYKDNMYMPDGTYSARIKVFIRNTWDWLTVSLRKSDVDYIQKHCGTRHQCAPTLQKHGKEWFLSFPFEEKTQLTNAPVTEQTILAVDLGINTSATVSVMRYDGTVMGRHFCKLPKEYDCLNHAINRIKKAQQHGNHKIPRLWAKAKGINHDISVKTANYIMDIAALYNADVIVFEHLDRNGKVLGSKKQRLKLWRSQEVQSMVTTKAHRLGMRISRICAWGTSKLAYDGSGEVLRGKNGGFSTYELCKFQSGKTYNCDLSASYNIGARYFIREILKSLDENLRLRVETKDSPYSKRSTCTLSTLIS